MEVIAILLIGLYLFLKFSMWVNRGGPQEVVIVEKRRGGCGCLIILASLLAAFSSGIAAALMQFHR